MTGDLAVFAAKLALGTLAFLLIGWIGTVDDKRAALPELPSPAEASNKDARIML